jgi:hypothetical protein
MGSCAAPRARVGGHELALPSWDRAVAEDWLGKWAIRAFRSAPRTNHRCVRLPAYVADCGEVAPVSRTVKHSELLLSRCQDASCYCRIRNPLGSNGKFATDAHFSRYYHAPLLCPLRQMVEHFELILGLNVDLGVQGNRIET